MFGRKSSDDSQQLQEFIRELTANQGRLRAFLVSLMPGSPDSFLPGSAGDSTSYELPDTAGQSQRFYRVGVQR